MTDIRLGTDCLRHPKIRKLRRRLGADGIVALVSLWCFAGERRQTGTLDGMNAEDIALAGDWQGDQEVFRDTLIELRLLDADENGILSIHGWDEHQPWIIHAPDRTAKAKKASAARWGKKSDANACSEHAPSMPDALPADATSNAPSPTPSPTPSPSPKREAPRARGTRLPKDWSLPDEWKKWAAEARTDVDPDLEGQKFADYWHAKTGKDATKADWQATWRNWIRNARPPTGYGSGTQKAGAARGLRPGATGFEAGDAIGDEWLREEREREERETVGG